MPFEKSAAARKRVAVIGGGISGLGAAFTLAEDCHVVLYESASRLGGHARTVLAGQRGDQPVDTGFIVFNYANYPHLTSLFERLDVPVAPSNMSFTASLDGGRIEYALKTLNSLIGQRRNVLRPQFYRMLRDILRFNARARDVAIDPEMTVGALLDELGTGDWFRDCYLLPFSGAIWSTPKDKILDFPAQAMIRFFENHALLGYTGQHQWYTVRGGSVEYVRRIEAALRRKSVDIRTSTPVRGVRRLGGLVEVGAGESDWEVFDEVVFATHGDDTLRMLADPSPEERAALGLVRYQPNEAILHADTTMMPKRKSCWSSWNYTEAAGENPDRIGLTYWMNSLQPIPETDPLFVTLNPTREIRHELIYDTATFQHPVYDHDMLKAQRRIRALNGARSTWFCGAWMKDGFHEDGLASAIDVVDAMRGRAPAQMAAE